MVFTSLMSAASFLRNSLKMINLSGDKNELKPDDNSGFDAMPPFRDGTSQSLNVSINILNTLISSENGKRI